MPHLQVAAEEGVPAEKYHEGGQLVHSVLGPLLGQDEHDRLDVQERPAHAPNDRRRRRRRRRASRDTAPRDEKKKRGAIYTDPAGQRHSTSTS